MALPGLTIMSQSFSAMISVSSSVHSAPWAEHPMTSRNSNPRCFIPFGLKTRTSMRNIFADVLFKFTSVAYLVEAPLSKLTQAFLMQKHMFDLCDYYHFFSKGSYLPWCLYLKFYTSKEKYCLSQFALDPKSFGNDFNVLQNKLFHQFC